MRKRQRLLWYSIAVLFLLGFAGFLTGFTQALNIGLAVTRTSEPVGQSDDRPSLPSAVADGHMVALGDSLARGTGDPTGRGFAGRTQELLSRDTGDEIDLINLAVEGMRSDELLDQLQDPGALVQIEGARWILLSIGGNDLRDVERTPALEQDNLFAEQQARYLENLAQCIDQIRSVNDRGQILVLGLYNPNDEATIRTLEMLHQWNHQTQLLLTPRERTLFVPTYDLFANHLEDALSFDGLHPNEQGHQAIARRFSEVLSLSTE